MDIEKPRRPHPILKWFFRLCLLAVLLVGGLVGYWIYTAPQLTGKAIKQDQSTTEYLDAHGQVFYSNDTMPLKKVSPAQFKRAKVMKDALLSIEDRDFYQETGTNPKRIAVAAYHDLKGLVRGGNTSVQGASTLTQQLIKLSYFSTKAKDRTIKRKVQEIYLAERLNHVQSKNTILYAYFNKVYLGNGIHGMQTAARYYFHKDVDQLNPVEAATIAGMVQSPTAYDPYRRPALTKQRRNTVLLTMYQNGKLSKTAFKQAVKVPLKASMPTYRTQIDQLRAAKQAKLNNDYYVSAVNAQLSDSLGHDGTNTIMRIQTPFEPAVQKAVNEAVNTQKFPSEHLQTAIVVINNHNGQVVALNGGRLNSQQVVGGYNRAITSSRSSGSAIKPVLDYAPAFDLFHATPDAMVQDTPFNYPGTNTAVHNWDNRFLGNISARRALVASRNVPAVRYFSQIGIEKETKLLNALDIPTKNVFAPLAIGTNVSPLALTDAYTALANGGVRIAPQFATRVQYQGAKLALRPQRVQTYSPGAAYMVTDVLKGVFTGEGTAQAAKIDGLVAAGKTGAADGGSSMPKDALTDAWFVGYTPQYTVGVWTGYDNPYNPHEYLKTADENISQELYKKVMQALMKQPGFNRSQDFMMPSDIHRSGNSLDWNSTQAEAPFLSNESQANGLKAQLIPAKDLDRFFNQ